jgi:tetratricopeptide (TPR) repeat protein
MALEQFLAFFPGSRLASTVRFRNGLLLFGEKDYLRAGVEFTRALEDSAPPDVRKAASFNLALCQRLSGAPEEARAALERYRDRWPGDERTAEIATQLGDLDESSQRWDEAVKEYRAALAAKPAATLETELHFRLGRALEQKGDAAAALAAFQQAAGATDRDHPYRLSALARCATAAADRASQLEAATKRR